MTQSSNHPIAQSPNGSVLLQSAIQRLIPHRFPFLLVDRVTEFTPGERIVGIKNVSLNDEMSQGYFSPKPAVPLSVVLEAVTQLGAILVLARPEMVDKVAVILQIPSAKSLKSVQPGDSLRLEARVLKLKENFGELYGSAFLDGECVGEGHMRFAIANAAELLPEKPGLSTGLILDRRWTGFHC
jgi:3-hydroxymyristoyl/3-hydroxydecanoyl-(acyl carrier protein) dehydratase